MSPIQPLARAARVVFVPLIVPAVLGVFLAACDDSRKKECDDLLAVMKPLDEGTPTPEQVDNVANKVDAMKFQDQPLGVYAKNYRATLLVLSNTLRLKASPNPPDGTDDVVKAKLREARTARVDTARHCSQ